MLKPRYLIGFSGHRSGFSETEVHASLVSILTDLQRRATAIGGQIELYTSIAEGTDTLCVEVASELGIPVHILLPLPENEFQKDFSSPATWERSKKQLEQASVTPGNNSVRMIEGQHSRPECYFDQGVSMLEVVDMLIAVWNEQPAKGLGGTAQMVSQAHAIGTPVIQINPLDGSSRTDEKSIDLAISRDLIVENLNRIAQQPDNACVREISTPDDLQSCLDTIALNKADNFRPSLVMIILIHGIAAILATLVTFKSDDKNSWWEKYKWGITAIELALVCIALWIGWRLHVKHTQQAWIRCRFACELVRGLRASIPLADPLYPTIARHDPDWRRFALSAGLLIAANTPYSSATLQRDYYIATRLGEDHPDSQIKHYREKSPRALWWWNTTSQIGAWSATLAAIFVLFSLLNKLNKWQFEYHLPLWFAVVFLPITLPLIAGVASSLRHALDAGRRKDRYPQMEKRLTEIRNTLKGLETTSSIRHAVAHSEEILLDELREWQLTATTTGH